MYQRLSTEIFGPAGYEGSGKGEREWAGTGVISIASAAARGSTSVLSQLFQVALHWVGPGWAKERPTSHRGVQVGFRRADLLPSLGVTALRWWSNSHSPLFLLDTILTYSFGWVRVCQQVLPISLVWEFGDTLSTCGKAWGASPMWLMATKLSMGVCGML